MGTTKLASDPENLTETTEGPVKTQMYATIKKICNPDGQYRNIWNKIFVTSCVFAVSLDPLFFYILIVDQQNKCLQMDTLLQTVALLLRSFTDIIFLVHFIYEIFDGVKTQREKSSGANLASNALKNMAPTPNTQKNTPSNSKVPPTGGHSGPKSKIMELIRVAKKIAHKMSWLSVSIIIDFFALLPIPQLLIVVAFYNMRGSSYLEHKKVLNIFLLGQYIPRIFRIHLSSNHLKKTTGIWIKSLFNFFLYILASHVLGAFWYFFSIQRETSCWHQACVDHNTDPMGCVNTFYCNGRTATSRNITFLNEHCPLDTPDSASPPFNFGIFLDSLQNQNTERIKFGKKFFYSFWWGLRNLSNFGTNLTTSTYVWENLFAILISIIGLLLFLYLIGNLQTFMQMEATKSEEIRQRIKMKKVDICSWISTKELPGHLRKEIRNSIKQKLKEHKDTHVNNDLFSILPVETRKSLRHGLCMKPLRTVKMLKDMDKKVLHLMCDYLKHVTYNENSFIFRKGDPLDCMLIIIHGNVWTYSTRDSEAGKASPSSMDIKTLEKDHIYGEELLDWASDTFTELPICNQHVKSQTKVEAFVLMAKDLATVVSKCQLQWNFNKCSNNPQEVKKVAASTILRRLRHNQALMSSSSPRLRSSAGGGATTTTAAVATPIGENSPLKAINYYLKKR